MTPRPACIVVLLACLAAACSEEAPAPGILEARILRVATDYAQWDSVYLDPHWGPMYCAPIGPASLMSEANDESPHGRRLYFLYTIDNPRFEALAEPVTNLVSDPVRFDPGFALVKESWTPVPREDGTHARGEKHALFIMLRVEDSIESDEGWVYATTSPDGTRVDGVGRIESCMECHAKAKHGRLFGPVEGARTRSSWQREPGMYEGAQP